MPCSVSWMRQTDGTRSSQSTVTIKSCILSTHVNEPRSRVEKHRQLLGPLFLPCHAKFLGEARARKVVVCCACPAVSSSLYVIDNARPLLFTHVPTTPPLLIHTPAIMPGLVAQSSSTSQSKRILQDSTSSRRNEQASPSKRRKLEDGANKFVKPARRDVNGGLVGSSQPKSQFESEVLEKLTQDIGTLKKKNAEKDQH